MENSHGRFKPSPCREWLEESGVLEKRPFEEEHLHHSDDIVHINTVG